MVTDRFKGYLFIVVCFTTFWFTILFLCLPDENTQLEQWPLISDENKSLRSSNSPSHLGNSNLRHSAPPAFNDHTRHLISLTPKLSLKETLLYDFNPSLGNDSLYKVNSSKADHITETSKLATITRYLDELVKQDGDELFAFNLLVSNRIGSLRALPDTRNPKCPKFEEVSSNPTSNEGKRVSSFKASIIICYYNEAPSALLRTINSIVLRSPAKLIEEIIIVDDHSKSDYGVDLIRQHIELLSSRIAIHISRTPRREGLIRARLFGADMAKGDVLIFLDSHVEANVGWLEPLIEAIEKNATTIACPTTDPINAETMVYSACPMVKGGLNWAFNFKWDSILSEELKKPEDFIKPIESPTMAGGLYAIKRDYFYHLGAYDRGMELWGGENVEMSLRTWMCGGRIVILPCSRVGHIFRKKRPYGPEPNQADSLLINSHRTARVWLDEYIENYYNHYPHARRLIDDDISERQRLRVNLMCNNFSWFLDNIYPKLKEKDSHKQSGESKDVNLESTKLFAPNSRRINRSADVTNRRGTQKNALVYKSEFEHQERLANRQQIPEPLNTHRFQIQLSNSNLCLKAQKSFMTSFFMRPILDLCVPMTINQYRDDERANADLVNQLWTKTEIGDLRLNPNRCIDLLKNLPIIRNCHNMGSPQQWIAHNNQTLATHIYNPERGLCLAVERIQSGEPVVVTLCDEIVEDSTSAPRRHRYRGQTAGWIASPTMGRPFDPRQESLSTLEPNQRWNLLMMHENPKPNI